MSKQKDNNINEAAEIEKDNCHCHDEGCDCGCESENCEGGDCGGSCDSCGCGCGGEEKPMTPEEENAFLSDRLQQYAEQFEKLMGMYSAEKKRADDAAIANTRLQAEFDNYRKRNSEAVKSARADGVADVMSNYIPTLDVFEKALSMITDKAVAEGMRMLYRQLCDLPAAYGVREIDSLGLEFTPELHEAVGRAPHTEDGVVVAVVRKGYYIGDKVLRHAQVIVGETKK